MGYGIVKIEKNKLFGGGMTEEIHLCMRNLFINTDDSIKILDI